MSKLILYRGDATKIDEFQVKETRKSCLYGRGIYLTVDKEVANDYRVKDNQRHHSRNDMLCYREETRNGAIKHAEFALKSSC